MGKRTSYSPGAFSWVDLATTDAAAAKSFYAGLFGWETEDHDAGGGASTRCAASRATPSAGSSRSRRTCAPRASRRTGRATSPSPTQTPPRRARRSSGGSVVGDAYDVLDIGRMAVLKDPQGAVFAVWQPRTRIGAERVNDVGCLCMNELATTDIDAARSFYEGLFGWTTEMVDTGPDGPPMVLALDPQRALFGPSPGRGLPVAILPAAAAAGMVPRCLTPVAAALSGIALRWIG